MNMHAIERRKRKDLIYKSESPSNGLWFSSLSLLCSSSGILSNGLLVPGSSESVWLRSLNGFGSSEPGLSSREWSSNGFGRSLGGMKGAAGPSDSESEAGGAAVVVTAADDDDVAAVVLAGAAAARVVSDGRSARADVNDDAAVSSPAVVLAPATVDDAVSAGFSGVSTFSKSCAPEARSSFLALSSAKRSSEVGTTPALSSPSLLLRFTDDGGFGMLTLGNLRRNGVSEPSADMEAASELRPSFMRFWNSESTLSTSLKSSVSVRPRAGPEASAAPAPVRAEPRAESDCAESDCAASVRRSCVGSGMESSVLPVTTHPCDAGAGFLGCSVAAEALAVALTAGLSISSSSSSLRSRAPLRLESESESEPTRRLALVLAVAAVGLEVALGLAVSAFVVSGAAAGLGFSHPGAACPSSASRSRSRLDDEGLSAPARANTADDEALLDLDAESESSSLDFVKSSLPANLDDLDPDPGLLLLPSCFLDEVLPAAPSAILSDDAVLLSTGFVARRAAGSLEDPPAEADPPAAAMAFRIELGLVALRLRRRMNAQITQVKTKATIRMTPTIMITVYLGLDSSSSPTPP
eukprot:comp21247_c0_seq1/m.45382 comp21247_c0_seq1/g.45382  ORF comp21247_c0_seq1/g.45382 comp21247_c0_seq1/m.45382 type:complete len:582 (+) comp21247_c0_seq1:16-1761(+)